MAILSGTMFFTSLGQKPYGDALREHPKGYTLIEVLVALAIFSGMLLLAAMALNQSIQRYQDLLKKDIGFWEYTKNIWLDKSLGSMSDYYVPSSGGTWVPYFIGNQSGLSYVSLAPVAADGPVFIWIKNERSENGKHRLVYYELPAYAKTVRELERAEIFAEYKKGIAVSLIDNIDSMNITFYGYDLALKQYRWSEEFYGKIRHLLPTIIKVTMLQAGSQIIRTFHIHVNSLTKLSYGERYRHGE